VTLRTNPTPGETRWICSVDTDPFDVADRLARRATVLTGGAETWVHLEGHGRDVDAQHASLPGRWDQVAGPPPLPAHRWSLRPSQLRTPPAGVGRSIAAVAVRLLFCDHAPSPVEIDPVSKTLAARAKALFDPTGRLNPGRDPSRR
jgi:hypothetical protein